MFVAVTFLFIFTIVYRENESFENKKIANLLNENFISIKVDREERPDVDKLYMGFIQVTLYYIRL